MNITPEVWSGSALALAPTPPCRPARSSRAVHSVSLKRSQNFTRFVLGKGPGNEDCQGEVVESPLGSHTGGVRFFSKKIQDGKLLYLLAFNVQETIYPPGEVFVKGGRVLWLDQQVCLAFKTKRFQERSFNLKVFYKILKVVLPETWVSGRRKRRFKTKPVEGKRCQVL